MTYGIKLSTGQFLKNFSEHTGQKNSIPVKFDSVNEATAYANNHGVKNFTVEPFATDDGRSAE